MSVAFLLDIYPLADGGVCAFQVHFNGWKSKFDEWMDWESFRLAPCGSRSSAKREGDQTAGPAKKESSTRCVLVPARRTVRIRINRIDDW